MFVTFDLTSLDKIAPLKYIEFLHKMSSSFTEIVSKTLAIWDVITIPVYIVVLVCIVRNRNEQFSSSFFKLTISLGVAELLCTRREWVVQRGHRIKSKLLFSCAFVWV